MPEAALERGNMGDRYTIQDTVTHDACLWSDCRTYVCKTLRSNHTHASDLTRQF